MLDPMFTSRTRNELLRVIQSMLTEARHIGLNIPTQIATGSREVTYDHRVLANEAARIHAVLENYRDEPRGSPGLRRLRNSPQAETIRQDVLSDNKRARQEAVRKMESTMNDATATAAEPVAKKAKKAKAKKAAPKKAAKKTAKKSSKKAAGGAATARAPRMSFDENATISLKKTLQDANPRRAGSEAHGRLEVLRKHHGKTVKAYLGKGGVNQTLINMVKAGEASVK